MSQGGLKAFLRSRVPVSLYPILSIGYRLNRKLVVRRLKKDDERYVAANGPVDVPPAELRVRVAGVQTIESFIARGEALKKDIEGALASIGMGLKDFKDALDFGCGSGCTIRAFKTLPGLKLSGTDIDAEAITWCKANIPFATFTTNGEYPPLPFPEGSFDLCWSVSVFTHLDEEHQFKWLEELGRVIRPGGIVLASVHGPDCWRGLPPETVRRIEEEGFVYAVFKADKGVFPDWYQNAWHTERYVRERWGKYFDVLAYIPRGVCDYQDMVVMRRR